MWFGTFDGLNRYDGYNFKVFRNKFDDTTSLGNPFINALSEDKNGFIWVGSRKGVNIYNSLNDKFTRLRLIAKGTTVLVDDVIKTIQTDNNNHVFVGTENTGLLLCSKGEQVGKSIPLHTGKEVDTLFGVQSIKIAPDNKVWVFVQNRGLCLFDENAMALKLVNNTVQSAYCLELDGKDILIGSNKGLFQFNTSTNICTAVMPGLLESERIIAISRSRNYSLWLGTADNGIYIWNKTTGNIQKLDAGDSKYSLSSGSIYAIYEDEELRKWIGTAKGGINIIDQKKQRFQLINHDAGSKAGFSGNSVSFFYEAPDSSLWIGTDDAGINIWDRKKNSFTHITQGKGEASLPSNAITSIKKDATDHIWVSTFNAGIIRYNLQGREGRRYKCINPVSGFENAVVYTVLEDSKKNLWASTLREGNRYGALYYYNRIADRFDAFDPELSDLFVLYEDRSGNLWGGNLNKLVKIDRAAKKHQNYSIGQTIRALYEDTKGNFWVGTEGHGLLLFDRKKNSITSRYTTEHGLANNAILNILEDKGGKLWISTLNGLSQFDPVKKIFKNYFYTDGLQSNQFNYNAALILRSGEFAFGGIKGFNLFRPDQINTANITPPVAITSIRVNNIPVTADHSYVKKTNQDGIEELKLPYNDAVLSIDFAALEYSAPEKIVYSYFLEGWDRNWNNSGNLKTANYTRLSEGSYKFHIKSTNIDGEWNNKDVVIRIVVLPPWYRSWWAIIGYLLIAGSLLYIFWLYRTRQTRLKYEIELARVSIEKEKMEKEKHRAEYEKEKTVREAEHMINEKEKELNARRLDFFTSITHEFRTPLTLIINPVKDLLQKYRNNNGKTEDMTIVYRNARRLLSLVDQLLFFRKTDTGIDKLRPSRLNFYIVCYEVYLCFVQQAKLRNIRYNFVCDNQEMEIYADREKMEIVLYNLLSNALKYTADNGSIEFKITETVEEVEVTVMDTGTGIPADAGEKLFDKFYQAKGPGVQTKPGFGIGLFLVKQLVDLHKGSVSYESILEKGTTFRVVFKKGKEHFDADQIVDDSYAEVSFLHELKQDDELLNEEQVFHETTDEGQLHPVVSGKQVMLVVDDDKEIRKYVSGMFKDNFKVYEAESGKKGLEMAEKHQPDIIISDIKMEDGDGIDFCKKIKGHHSLNHIPVILLTGTHTSELKLEGVEGGADDYITKPFEKELLIARVNNLQKSRVNLQKYFFNEITLKKHDLKISEEDKEFLEKCMAIVEKHLEDDEFTITQLATEMGRSYSSVYKRIRIISGQSLQSFVRFVRLRKAAELFINSNDNVSEVAFRVGIYDAKFFREQFHKLFGLKPSEYIKKYRKPFQDQYSINPESGL
jgi:signal transduction histidine kinase/ligand-binding sensor domain-containing protein/DNA-binding response OmpR family regulator